MLHTVTNAFLNDKAGVSDERSMQGRLKATKKSSRIKLNVNDFKALLA